MKPAPSETITFLESHAIFQGVCPTDLAILFPFLETRHYKAGDHIIEEGAPSEAIHIITAGHVQVLKSMKKAPPLLLNELHKGDTFGEMGLFEGNTTSASVTAKTKTDTLVLSHQGMQDLFEIRPKASHTILMNLARDLSRRLRNADARIAKLVLAQKG